MKWISVESEEKPIVDPKYRMSDELLMLDRHGTIEIGTYEWSDDWKDYRFKYCGCCSSFEGAQYWSYTPKGPL